MNMVVRQIYLHTNFATVFGDSKISAARNGQKDMGCDKKPWLSVVFVLTKLVRTLGTGSGAVHSAMSLWKAPNPSEMPSLLFPTGQSREQAAVFGGPVRRAGVQPAEPGARLWPAGRHAGPGPEAGRALGTCGQVSTASDQTKHEPRPPAPSARLSQGSLSQRLSSLPGKGLFLPPHRTLPSGCGEPVPTVPARSASPPSPEGARPRSPGRLGGAAATGQGGDRAGGGEEGGEGRRGEKGGGGGAPSQAAGTAPPWGAERGRHCGKRGLCRAPERWVPSPRRDPEGLGVTGAGRLWGTPFSLGADVLGVVFLSIKIAEIIKPALTCICLHGELSVRNGSLSFKGLLSLKLPV